MIALILCALAGALARRLAGGVVRIPGGTLVARAAGGAALCAGLVPAAWAGGAPLWLPAGAGVLFWCGMASGFPAGGMVPRSIAHVGAISLRVGGALALVPAMAAWWLGLVWWPLVAAAAAVGPVYWLATLWQPAAPWLGFNKGGLPDPPAWAEPWVGAGLGLALGVAVMGGGR